MTQLRRLLAAAAVTAVAAALLSTVTPALADTSTGSIGGTLTSAAGVPLADVTVVVHATAGGGDTSPARTDGAGRYSVAGLAPGAYKVEFWFEKTAHSQWAHQATHESAATTFRLRAGENLVVDESTFPTGSMSVTYRSQVTGELVDAFCVDATGDFFATAGCTDTGTVRLTELPVGEYAVLARAKAEPRDHGVGFPTVEADKVAEVAIG